MALALGVPVSELQERISSQEFTYWIAYNQIDPFGGFRGDLQAAMISYSAVAPHVKKKPKIEQFLLNFKKPKRYKDPREIFQYFKSIAKNGSN